MTAVYYNEIDPFAAAWLRELIKRDLIAPGVVDERSIEDITPNDLVGYTQCHFFSGIGAWSYALRQAGWPDDRPVWTGSAPCQPFSGAGKRKGILDERHLWPAFHRLIQACKPDVVMGEQVANGIAVGKDQGPGIQALWEKDRILCHLLRCATSRAEQAGFRRLILGNRARITRKGGYSWLNSLQHDLEADDYTVGASVTAACGFGTPHQRKRLFWVGALGHPKDTRHGNGISREQGGNGGKISGQRQQEGDRRTSAEHSGEPSNMADACRKGLPPRQCQELPGAIRNKERRAAEQRGSALDKGLPGPTNGHWRDVDWLGCRDGKWRPVEPAFEQMANGVASCLGHLRLHGEASETEALTNAISKEARSCEVLRTVQKGHDPKTVWFQVGRQVGFLEASILLASLCQHAGELGAVVNSEAQGGAQELSHALRRLWANRIASCPSQGWRLSQQFTQELTDLVRQLPQIDALEAVGGLNGSPLANGAPARVGRLRGYGNAIVAQQAQAFIEAFMSLPNAEHQRRANSPSV